MSKFSSLGGLGSDGWFMRIERFLYSGWAVGLAGLTLLLVFSGTATSGEPPAATAPEGAQPQFGVMNVVAAQMKQQGNVHKLLKQEKLTAAERAALQAFYGQYALPCWTQPDNVPRLVDAKTPANGFRGKLRGDLQIAVGEAHTALNEIALKTLKQMADGNYHPAARVNAMLAIGELNQTERAGTSEPVPYPEALPVLEDEAKNLKQHEAVRIAAMVGIKRHIESRAVPVAEQPKLLAMLQGVVAEAEVPVGSNADGHDWLRSQAAELLGALGSAGQNPAAAQAVGAMLADKNVSTSARRMAAKAMGQMKITAGGNLPVAQWTIALGQLAIDSCTQDEGRPTARRRLKERLVAVGQASAAIKPLASDDATKQKLAAVDTSVQQMIAAIDGKKDAEVAPLRVKLEAALK